MLLKKKKKKKRKKKDIKIYLFIVFTFTVKVKSNVFFCMRFFPPSFSNAQYSAAKYLELADSEVNEAFSKYRF